MGLTLASGPFAVSLPLLAVFCSMTDQNLPVIPSRNERTLQLTFSRPTYICFLLARGTTQNRIGINNVGTSEKASSPLPGLYTSKMLETESQGSVSQVHVLRKDIFLIRNLKMKIVLSFRVCVCVHLEEGVVVYLPLLFCALFL